MNLQPYRDEGLLLADGLDEALVGMGAPFGKDMVAIYDIDKILDILVARDGMTYDEAVEFFDYNIGGAYVGEGTPIFIKVIPQETGVYENTNTASTEALLTPAKQTNKKKGKLTK